jgi:hypothetical protein
MWVGFSSPRDIVQCRSRGSEAAKPYDARKAVVNVVLPFNLDTILYICILNIVPFPLGMRKYFLRSQPYLLRMGKIAVLQAVSLLQILSETIFYSIFCSPI